MKNLIRKGTLVAALTLLATTLSLRPAAAYDEWLWALNWYSRSAAAEKTTSFWPTPDK